MSIRRWFGAALAAAMLLAPVLPGTGRAEAAAPDQRAAPRPRMVVVTIQTGTGPHRFTVEQVSSAQDQERGLMYRTDIPADGGMLFAPYPGGGGAPPKVARFWMKNTPSALDILFIRKDGTIARIAVDAEPYSEVVLSSEEPVSAVLEINAGRTVALGIVAGDKVSWARR